MLKRGNEYLLYLLIVIYLFGCKEGKENYKKEEKLMSIAKKDEVIKIKQLAKDTLFSWIEAKTENRSAEDTTDYNRIFVIDSIVGINDSANKIIMAVLYSNKDLPASTMDAISHLYGVKISLNWYFFHGAIIHLPREYYQKDITTPLSFEKLHEIAMKEVFSGYLIKKKKDAGFWKNTFSPEYEYEVNEEWFDSHFKGSGWGCGYMSDTGWVDTCSVKEFDKIYLEKALSIWKK